MADRLRFDFAGHVFTAWPVADALGEGPVWHPLRQRLVWFDITGRRLHELDPAAGMPVTRSLPEMCSAAAWIDERHMLVAGEAGMHRLDLEDGSLTALAPFPAPDPRMRGNDGRPDPWGRFWIGTMGRGAEPGLGALYRYGGGGFETLAEGVSIPNSTAFSPDRRTAWFADSPTRTILAFDLDPGTGRPRQARIFATVPAPAVPDGSVADAEGFLWNAEWNGARLVRYAPDGRVDRVVALPVPRPTCPAFGGPGLRTLFVTSARHGMDEAALAAAPLSGALLALDVGVAGTPEHRFAG